MARAPDERYESAKAMFLQGMKLVEIASRLNLPEGTVRRWKSTHKWESERSDKNSERSDKKKKRGGQPGNKNGTGPPENKNAVKTGEFETLLFDCLEPEERRLADAVPEDKIQLILQEIKLLTVRERRMLKRMEALKASTEFLNSGEELAGMTLVNLKRSTEKGMPTELKEYRGKLGQIQAIEDALTRVQGRKQNAIDSLHRYGYDDAKLKLEMQKYQTDPDETENDGFLDALAETIKEDWKADETGGI